MNFYDPYGGDVLKSSSSQRYGHRRQPQKQYPRIPAEPGLVVEDVNGWVGAIVDYQRTAEGEFLALEDRRGKTRLFKMRPGAFLIDGEPVDLVRYVPKQAPRRSNSGSRRVENLRAKVAQPSRIWVEGIHDAAIVEKVWGHDLRVEGVVVEYLEGLDNLWEKLEEFQPSPGRRVGVLADHLIEGTKEKELTRDLGVYSPYVMVTGHPYIDIWEAVKPRSVKIASWPRIPYGVDWKTGVCQELGWGSPQDGWRKVYSSIHDFRDLDSTLIGAVERLVDFVTVPPGQEQ